MAAPKKKPVTKKSTATKAAKVTKATKVAPKKTTRKTTKKPVGFKSFKQSSEQTPFMTFSFTNQTLYWMILSVLVVALGAWVLYLNAKVQNIYDQIDANSSILESQIVPKEKSAKQ